MGGNMPGNGAINQAAIDLFKAKAKPVTIEVVEVKNLEAAMDYAVETAEKSEPAKLMPITEDRKILDADPSRKKILAAPSLSDADYQALSQKGLAKGLEMVRSDMRRFLAGFEVAFTVAGMAVGETASVISENNDEDYRLATMVCETHVVAVPKSKVVKTLMEVVPFMTEALGRESNYTSFVSGPSRTADIERVLTLGVHGPLYLHVALMEE
jgi:L-lactate dehydrogenase complex protein LldG